MKMVRVIDSASVHLRSIRQQLRIQVSRVRENLESYTRGKNASKMLSDSIITIRNDRYVFRLNRNIVVIMVE